MLSGNAKYILSFQYFCCRIWSHISIYRIHVLLYQMIDQVMVVVEEIFINFIKIFIKILFKISESFSRRLNNCNCEIELNFWLLLLHEYAEIIKNISHSFTLPHFNFSHYFFRMISWNFFFFSLSIEYFQY